jgi:hypothetical protein
LGIGFDAKVMLLVFNIEGTATIKVQCYSRHTGDTQEVSITTVSGERAAYKLLGVNFRGAYPDISKNAQKVTLYQFLLRKVLWRKLPIKLIQNLLQQGVVSKILIYAVLLTNFSDEAVARMDTAMAEAGKHNMVLAISAPRGTPFAPRESFGGGMPSAVTHYIAGTAREYMILLNQRGYVGTLARNTMDYLVSNSDKLAQPSYRNSIIAVVERRLARWGLHLSCAREGLVNRVRDEALARAVERVTRKPPCFTARPVENKRIQCVHEDHSFFGSIADSIRLGLKDEYGDDFVPLVPCRQVRNPLCGQPELRELAAKAFKDDEKDFRSYMIALGTFWIA